jgi:hypothetical protein
MNMPLNPLAGALMAGAQVQQRQTAERATQARRSEIAEQAIIAPEDSVELSVESADELSALHEDGHNNQNPRQKKKKHDADEDDASEENPESHLDLTA